MPKLLHLQCSPRGQSVSTEAAREFLKVFSRARPGFDVDTLDIWREQLPPLSESMLQAKDAVQRNTTFTDAQREAWAVIERMVFRLSIADRLLISTPMWNFGLPYQLKHYIDLINQPRLTFRFDPAQGYIPLLKDRPTLVIVASSGDFITGHNRGRTDMATPYLRDWLRFIGIRTFEIVSIGPTVGQETDTAAVVSRAHERLRNIASRF